jgi:lipopolysaccharide transport system ATP-binding protein
VTELALQASDLTKIFKVWNRPSDMLSEILTGRVRHTDFHALDSVSFDLPRGSVLGVLGRNGAGKSTLLRLVAGTLDATRGRVVTNGRIASILELGTGFHLDYSGRENVFLGGMCLGLSRREIKERFDEIVEFSELAEFIDRPFRTYSSGMQARLTFAVATSIDPDILIIDEALSVGDARFTLKSFDRIQTFRRQGKAILLVSHDINTVSSFCDQAILLERGKLIASGSAAKVANIYHELLFGTPTRPAVSNPAGAPVVTLVSKTSVEQEGLAPGIKEGEPIVEQPALDPASIPDLKVVQPEPSATSPNDEADHEHLNQATSEQFRRYGDLAVEIVRFEILDSEGRRVSRLRSLAPYTFRLRLRAGASAKDVGVGILIRTAKGMQVTAANSLEPAPTLVCDFEKAGDEADILVPFNVNMGHGTYFASAIAARSDRLKHDAQFDVLEFSVERTHCHDDSVANLNMSFELATRETSTTARKKGAGGGR